MTTHTPWTTFLVVLLIAGCGLGTEVGNGFKPEKEKRAESTGAKTADDANNPAAEQGGAADSDGVDEGAVDEDAPPYEPTFTFDIDLLVANCGSPFGEDLQTPIRLADRRGTAEANILEAEDDGSTGIWALSDKDGTLLRQVTPSASTTDAAVTATNTQAQPVGTVHTCTNISRTPGVTVSGLSGTYLRVQTTVLLGSRANVVAWYLEGTAAPYRLARVTVDDVDGEDDPLVLDAD